MADALKWNEVEDLRRELARCEADGDKMAAEIAALRATLARVAADARRGDPLVHTAGTVRTLAAWLRERGVEVPRG